METLNLIDLALPIAVVFCKIIAEIITLFKKGDKSDPSFLYGKRKYSFKILQGASFIQINKTFIDNNRNESKYYNRNKINLHDPYEIQYWIDKWSISHKQLIDATQAAGSTEVEMVEKYLSSDVNKFND